MTSGLSRCRECGLALTIDIEEPRCECGYLLFRLEGIQHTALGYSAIDL